MEQNRKMLYANFMAFCILGMIEASWAPMAPFVKSSLNFNDGQFGQLLLCMGVGSIIALPIVGSLVNRFGPRAVSIAGGILLGVNLVGITLSSELYVVASMLCLFGASLVAIDVAANVNAVIVESVYKRPLMSGFHGGYSFGTLVGALIMSLMLTLGIGISNSALIICIVMSVLSVVTMLPMVREVKSFNANKAVQVQDVTDNKKAKFNIPPTILIIGIMCFIMYGSEGALLSWTAVFATQNRGIDPVMAGYFYTFFAIAMTTSRLLGNRIVARYGRRITVVTGALCVSSGFILTAVIPHFAGMMIGFTLVGLGAGNIVPQLVSYAGTVKGIKVQSAISMVNALGYSGILLGPVIIGHISNLSSLEISFITLGLGVFTVAALSFVLLKDQKS